MTCRFVIVRRNAVGVETVVHDFPDDEDVDLDDMQDECDRRQAAAAAGERYAVYTLGLVTDLEDQ